MKHDKYTAYEAAKKLIRRELERGNINQAQYEKSIKELAERLGI